jgi:ABC-type molybdate transport system substrate-binding protein
MKPGMGLIRIIKGTALATLFVAVTAGVGTGAPGGSQVVTVAAAANLDITVPPAAAIASTAPDACGTTSTVINVKSNKPYNLQIRSEPLTYPDGKAKFGTTALTNAFQYGLAGTGPWTNLTSTYADIFGSSQPKTTGLGVNHQIFYQQCIDWADDPGTYTIVVEYLGVQP